MSEFTQEKRLYYLDKIDNLSKNAQTIVSDKIKNFDLNSSINRLRRHKKKTRDAFTNLANEIAESNNVQLIYIQEDVLKILEQYKKSLDKIVKELNEIGKKNIQKYKKSNNSDYNIDEQDFEKKFTAKKNIVEKLYDDNLLLPILNCIPVINLGAIAFTGIAAFFDWARSHEEEYEEYIVKYEKDMKEKIESLEYQARSSIKKMENIYKNYTSNFFDINGEDLEIIKGNKNLFIEIRNKFENILLEIINSN